MRDFVGSYSRGLTRAKPTRSHGRNFTCFWGVLSFILTHPRSFGPILTHILTFVQTRSLTCSQSHTRCPTRSRVQSDTCRTYARACSHLHAFDPTGGPPALVRAHSRRAVLRGACVHSCRMLGSRRVLTPTTDAPSHPRLRAQVRPARRPALRTSLSGSSNRPASKRNGCGDGERASGAGGQNGRQWRNEQQWMARVG